MPGGEGPSEPREEMEYDVCVVGAGPAGLAAALRLKQLAGEGTSVCVLEKGAEPGAHTLSGNVFDPRAMDELFPAEGPHAFDWRGALPAGTAVPVAPAEERSLWLTAGGGSLPLPTPPSMHNAPDHLVCSLSMLTRVMAERAEAAGVDVFPGFAASELLRCPDTGALAGVATGDFGVSKSGERTANFARGVAVRARATLLAEGCRGSLSEQATRAFGLRERANGGKGAQHQTYALGLKEVWEVPPEKHVPGRVWHTVGHPLDTQTYGGGFLYHMAEGRVALGLVVGLDYRDPYLSPFGEFQKWKLHPAVREQLEGGRCVQYGARTLVEGGLQSLPAMGFAGGALLGCAAGTLNAARIKGAHTAMKSGILAAEEAARQLDLADGAGGAPQLDLGAYDAAFRASWAGEELWRARNFRPGFKWGVLGGMANAGLEAFVFRGQAPWTLAHHAKPDHACLEPAEQHSPREYPRPDGELTFDRPSALFLSGTNHEHDQPAHLKLRDPDVPAGVNLPEYAGPEERYCPAGVYEYVEADSESNAGREGAAEDGAGGAPEKRLQINAQNCLHCKACDIKDPTQNIEWTVPEGGGGPGYQLM